MTLESNKTLGGIGVLLMVLGGFAIMVSAFAGVLSLIGLILWLVAMKGMADHYKEGGIFNNALYGFVMTIVGAIAFVAALVVAFLTLLSSAVDWATFDWTTPSNLLNIGDFWTVLGIAIVGFVVLMVFFIISTLFYRKAFNSLAEKSGEHMFETAGLLMLIGALLTIILIGVIIILIAWILVAVAFFSIKTAPTASSTQTPQAPAS